MTCEPSATIDVGHDRITVAVDPRRGGRLASVDVDGVELLVRYGTRPETTSATGWGAYPMVPWAGRIRHGRFRFRGRIHDLPRTFGPHAIHGVGFATPWRTVGRDDTSVELELELPTDARWPLGGVARQRIAVDGDRIALHLSVTATDRAFPASIGWHPWFRKPQRIEFDPLAMYRRDEHGITVDELVEVPAGPWDDCFLNEQPVVVSIDGVTVTLSSNCVEWVVYDERSYATCIEPQTAPPDAPNIRPEVVEPGSTLSAWFHLDVAPSG